MLKKSLGLKKHLGRQFPGELLSQPFSQVPRRLEALQASKSSHRFWVQSLAGDAGDEFNSFYQAGCKELLCHLAVCVCESCTEWKLPAAVHGRNCAMVRIG